MRLLPLTETLQQGADSLQKLLVSRQQSSSWAGCKHGSSCNSRQRQQLIPQGRWGNLFQVMEDTLCFLLSIHQWLLVMRCLAFCSLPHLLPYIALHSVKLLSHCYSCVGCCDSRDYKLQPSVKEAGAPVLWCRIHRKVQQKQTHILLQEERLRHFVPLHEEHSYS